MPTNILSQVRRELKKHVDHVYKVGATNFFKEPIKVYGVRTPQVRKMARGYFNLIKTLPKKDLFKMCEELLKSGIIEEATIALSWALRKRAEYSKKDFTTFERWLKKYVSNWATCDDFCTHAFGYFLFTFPEFLPKLNIWAKSKNRWLRRASAVTLIYSARQKKNLNKIFEICGILLRDTDDLVQKGYGWTLKVAGDLFPRDVYRWVVERKDIMPRTALRYAIEKYPAEMKKKAMARRQAGETRPHHLSG